MQHWTLWSQTTWTLWYFYNYLISNHLFILIHLLFPHFSYLLML